MEQSVLQRVATGDAAAVQECVDSFGGLVWSIALRLTPTRADAEDVVQDIFIDLWRNAGRFDPERSSEAAFIAMIARRRAIDRLRSIRRRPETEFPDDGPSPIDEGHERIENGAEAALAARALEALGDEQQHILKLSIYHGLTHREIAEETGLPLGTVKTHVRRGLIQIRKLLGVRPKVAAEGSAT